VVAVLKALERHRLLLAADPILPSVATIVAGEPVRGSWWAHPRSHAIFAAISALSHNPHALSVPLVAGKVTFVHRGLWPALLAIAGAGEPWQTRRLSPSARRLLDALKQTGDAEASGDPAREIERRLLARGREVHTDRGSHAKYLERWDRWAARAGVSSSGDAAQAKRLLEDALAALGGGSRHRLPWQA
jgi:hypothetical protein